MHYLHVLTMSIHTSIIPVIISNVVTLSYILLHNNMLVITSSVVTLNCILLTSNQPVVTPSSVIFEM